MQIYVLYLKYVCVFNKNLYFFTFNQFDRLKINKKNLYLI